MKAYDVIGYAIDGAAYCCDCCGDLENNEEAAPIFAADENEYVCDDCFEKFN